MRKVIGAINMTLDGFFDHTTMTADEALHQHYTDLLNKGDVVLYGRITYQLMEFWPPLLKNPTGNDAMDDFAVAIDRIPKIVFSHTLKSLTWKTARLASQSLEEEVLTLRQANGGEGRDIFVGSRSLIVSLLNLNLIDELQICIQPIIAGKGLRLLENISDKIEMKLLNTKIFNSSGSIVMYYKPVKKHGS